MIQKKPHLHAGSYTSLFFFPLLDFFSLFFSFFFLHDQTFVVSFSLSLPFPQVSSVQPSLTVLLR